MKDRFNITPIVVNEMKVMLQAKQRDELRNYAEDKIKSLQASSLSEVPKEKYIELVSEIMEMEGYFDLLPVPVANMNVNRDEWLLIRQHGLHYDNPQHPEYLTYSVGGSTVGEILGESSFASPYMVKAKLQNKPIRKNKKSNDEILEVGHIAEEFISDYMDILIQEATNLKSGLFTSDYLKNFSEKFIRLMEMMQLENNAKEYFFWYFQKFNILRGKEIIKDETLFQHPVFKVLNGNVDRFLRDAQGNYEILEIKSTAVTNFDKQREYKEGVIPLQYLRQIQTYLSILNLNSATLVAGWGFHSQAISTISIKRDLKEEAMIIGSVLHFIYEVVEKDLDVPNTLCNPLVIHDDLERIVPYGEQHKVIETNNYGLLDDFKQLQIQIKEKKKELKILEDKLKVKKGEVLKIAGDATLLTSEDDEGTQYSIEIKPRRRNGEIVSRTYIT